MVIWVMWTESLMLLMSLVLVVFPISQQMKCVNKHIVTNHHLNYLAEFLNIFRFQKNKHSKTNSVRGCVLFFQLG